MKQTPKRCAIYTRKSTDEGLEQDFNSLHAQREACEAYITSQKAEGWKVVPTHYNDGGFSGGTMDRPGLQKLIAEIKARKIDIVVVYKIDRLTRSLMDFSKLVEIFDEYGVTFVSVTQSFNTTTSMGRLTLNVLLSFAQFEREVTGERIRDKIAASKKKGMWMGGCPPLGYDIDNHVLIIMPTEVDLARYIFGRYMKLKSVRRLKQELDREGFVSPKRISLKGNEYGGCKFSRGSLYTILKNPVYIGKISHKDKIHDGLHEGIIDEDVWHKTQEILQSNRVERKEVTKSRHMLQGLVVDAEGTAYSPVYTKKKDKRYCYYVSQNLLQHTDHPNRLIARLPAHEIESVIDKTIREHIATLCDGTEVAVLEYVLNNHHQIQAYDLVRGSVQKIKISLDNITIQLKPKALKELLDKHLSVSVTIDTSQGEIIIPYKTRRKSHGAIIVEPKGEKDPLDLPPEDLKRLVQGIVWRDEYFNGQTLKQIAVKEGYTDRHISNCIKRSFDVLAA